MKISWSAKTDVGLVRKRNEDFFLAAEDLGVFVVADGMGGHASGREAAELTCQTIQNYLAPHQSVLARVAQGELHVSVGERLMREAVEAAAQRVYAEGSRVLEKKGMGTTCTAFLYAGDKGVMAHVGDSRLYLLRGLETLQLSQDHTFLRDALKAGIITAEEARTSKFQNVITRAIGPFEHVVVDTLVFDLVPGDKVLLCSDGLHKHLQSDNDLISPGANGQPRDSQPQAAESVSGRLESETDRLMKIAMSAGADDNVTILLVETFVEVVSPSRVERDTLVHDGLLALRHVTLFAEFGVPELVRLLASCQNKSVPAGEVVLHEGERSSGMYILVEGSAAVKRGGQQAITHLARGAHFGEMALLNDRPRTATVSAVEACSLLVLERAPFFALLQQEPILAAKFLWNLSQSLSERLDDALWFISEARTSVDTLRMPAFGHRPTPFASPE